MILYNGETNFLFKVIFWCDRIYLINEENIVWTEGEDCARLAVNLWNSIEDGDLTVIDDNDDDTLDEWVMH